MEKQEYFLINLSNMTKKVYPGYEICRFFYEDPPMFVDGCLQIDGEASVYKILVCKLLSTIYICESTKRIKVILYKCLNDEELFPVLNDERLQLILKLEKTIDFEQFKRLLVLHLWDLFFYYLYGRFESYLTYNYREIINAHFKGNEQLESRKNIRFRINDDISEDSDIGNDLTNTVIYSISPKDLYAILDYEVLQIKMNDIVLMQCNRCGRFNVKRGNKEYCENCEKESNYFNYIDQKNLRRRIRKDNYILIWKNRVRNQLYRKSENFGGYEQEKNTLSEKLIVLNQLVLIRDEYLFFILLYLLNYNYPMDIKNYIELAELVISGEVKDYQALFKKMGMSDLFISEEEFWRRIRIQMILNTLHDIFEIGIKNKLIQNVKLNECSNIYSLFNIENYFLNELGYYDLNGFENLTLVSLEEILNNKIRLSSFDLSFIVSSEWKGIHDNRKFRPKKF